MSLHVINLSRAQEVVEGILGRDSVLRTCVKQGFDPVAVIKQLLLSAEDLILDLIAPSPADGSLPPAIASP